MVDVAGVSVWDLATWDWAAISQSALGAGAGTALIQIVVPVLRDRAKRKSHATFHALRVAVALEDYARAASDLISNHEVWVNSERHAGDAATRMPAKPVFPDDPEGWKAMNAATMERAMTFPQRADDNARSMSFAWDVGALDDYGDALVKASAERGLDACRVAATLRSENGLPVLEETFSKHLRDTLANIAENERKRQKRRDECMAERMHEDTSMPPAF